MKTCFSLKTIVSWEDDTWIHDDTCVHTSEIDEVIKKRQLKHDFKITLYSFSFCDATLLFAFDSIGFAAYLAANCQINKSILKRTLLYFVIDLTPALNSAKGKNWDQENLNLHTKHTLQEKEDQVFLFQ